MLLFLLSYDILVHKNFSGGSPCQDFRVAQKNKKFFLLTKYLNFNDFIYLKGIIFE